MTLTLSVNETFLSADYHKLFLLSVWKVICRVWRPKTNMSSCYQNKTCFNWMYECYWHLPMLETSENAAFQKSILTSRIVLKRASLFEELERYPPLLACDKGWRVPFWPSFSNWYVALYGVTFGTSVLTKETDINVLLPLWQFIHGAYVKTNLFHALPG